MGAGVMIRNHNGACVAPCSDSFEEVTIPELVEAMVMRRTLIFSKDGGSIVYLWLLVASPWFIASTR
jgi:hypothetical protein